MHFYLFQMALKTHRKTWRQLRNASVGPNPWGLMESVWKTHICYKIYNYTAASTKFVDTRVRYVFWL